MRDSQYAMLLEKEVYAYCEAHSGGMDELLRELDRETHLKTLAPQMLSGHLQGALLTAITRMSKSRRALEIGTFTGYSAICIARGLPDDGELVTLEANPEYAHIAGKYFEKAGMTNRIRALQGDALKLIPELKGSFDLVFMDANKREYEAYYELVLPLLAPRGLILADNVLWSRKVLEPQGDPDATALHAFNEKLSRDSRVHVLMLPLRDGISIIEKKAGA